MQRCLVGIITLLAFVSSVLGVTYPLSDIIVGSEFYNAFNFEAIADPSHGRVNYVDQATAQRQNLTFASTDTFILRADSTTVLSASGPGRNSVRIRSKKTYTTHVAVFNIRHMPQGCGTWLGVRETNQSTQSNAGKIDIIEGVNDQSSNLVTLHTSAGCTMPAARVQTGVTSQSDCNTALNGNPGCGAHVNTMLSYGPSFNNNGGGWYAVERTSSFIKVWFGARNDESVPPDVVDDFSFVNTDSWGTPSANFPDTNCDFFIGGWLPKLDKHLGGDWAGSSDVYSASGCPSTCVDYVNNNPSGFVNAYFDFASIKIYDRSLQP